MDNLASMGYGQPWREKVLLSTMKGYMRILNKCTQGTSRRNRKGAETWLKRRYNRLCGKASWYKLAGDYEKLQELAWDPEENQSNRNSNAKKHHKKPDDRYIESVMFVPYTPESQLKNQRQEAPQEAR